MPGLYNSVNASREQRLQHTFQGTFQQCGKLTLGTLALKLMGEWEKKKSRISCNEGKPGSLTCLSGRI